ncbi:MAG: hypothetical protein HY319_03980 [Armatimonadetes bacterium]|nr:hypothetical protein [Armatimonadota bacterium]
MFETWLTQPSIFEQIRTWDGMSQLEFHSPDESGVTFASGAWDGIATHHLAGMDEHEEARVVYALIEALGRLIRQGDEDSRRNLYRLALEDNLVHHVDALLAEVLRQDAFAVSELHPHARWLVERAAHAEPLKLGITLLGLSGGPSDLGLLQDLSRHDEFTLYAAVAAANLLEDPLDVWWDMAKNVRGWGKIHLVERLCERCEEREDLKRWLLEEGCSNDVMDEYLAFLCASAGDLARAVNTANPSEELLDGASVIVKALIRGGPAPDLADYEDGRRALSGLLSHFQERCSTLGRLELVRLARNWLESEDSESWEAELKQPLISTCRRILAEPRWPERVERAFGGEDPTEKFLAWDLSEEVGVDLWPAAFSDLESEPLQSLNYWRVLQTSRPERLKQVFRFAEANLPLTEIASGPAEELGFGPEYRAHGCLDFLLPAMEKADLPHWPILVAALRSPVVRNRHQALRLLEQVPPDSWERRARVALAELAAEDPDEEVRQKASELASRCPPPRV